MKSYIIIGRVEFGENEIFTTKAKAIGAAVKEFKTVIMQDIDEEDGNVPEIYIEAVIEVTGKFKISTGY